MQYPDSVIADRNQPLIHRMYTLLRWLEGDRLNPSILPPTQQAFDFYTGERIPPAQEGGEPFRYGHRAWRIASELLDEYDREQRHPSTASIPTTIYVLYSDMAMRHMGYYTDEGAARSDGTNHALDRYGRKQVGDWVRSPAPNVPAPMPTMPGEVRADGDSWWMPIYEGTPHGQGKIIDHYRVGPYKLFQGTAHGLEGFGGS